MSQIRTFTGKMFDPLNPKAELIDIHDIAHALSNLCRYTGHCPELYSVAQHSVYVAANCSEKNRLAGLLHDAGEAYMNDIASPVKHSWLMWGYRRAEDKLQAMVYEKWVPKEIYRGSKMVHVDHEEIKKVDLAVGKFEMHSFWGHPAPSDTLVYMKKTLGESFFPWTPKKAEKEFLKVFYLLLGFGAGAL